LKVVINACYGGFSLSRYASEIFNNKKGLKRGDEEYVDPKYGQIWAIDRHDPDLIAVIEELGNDANGEYAELKIVEIPDNTLYEIEEYDGTEWIAEIHRTWR